MPTGLIVADFFVPASVPSAELCLEDTVANTKGKREKGRPKRGQSCYVTPAFSAVPDAWRGEKNQKRIESPPRAGGRIRSGPLVGKVAT